MKTVSDCIIEQLALWKVKYIFGLPGTSALGLVEAVRKNADRCAGSHHFSGQGPYFRAAPALAGGSRQNEAIPLRAQVGTVLACLLAFSQNPARPGFTYAPEQLSNLP